MELQTSEGPKCKTKLLFLRTLNKRTSTTRSSCLAEAGRGNGTASALIFVVYNCYQHELVPLLLCSSFLIKRVMYVSAVVHAAGAVTVRRDCYVFVVEHGGW